MPGATTREVGRSGLADAVESNDDAPHRAEQTDERRNAGGRRQKRHAPLELVDFHDRCAHQGPVHGRQALQSRTSGGRSRIGSVARVGRRLAQLRGQFGVPGLKEADQRAVAERAADRLDFRKLAAAAKDVQELRGMFVGRAVRPQLIEDDAPRNDRQQQEQHAERLGRWGWTLGRGGRLKCSTWLSLRTQPHPAPARARRSAGFQACANGPPRDMQCAAGTARMQNCIMS